MEYVAKTKGKSSQPEAVKIMSKYEPPSDGFGGIVGFTGLTAQDAERLIGLGAMDPDETQNSSPSIAEFVALAKRFKGMTLFGYRVLPPRGDERISVEGFNVPSKSVSRKALVELAKLNADEFDEEDGEIRAWWD
jgi:hypothetical protein